MGIFDCEMQRSAVHPSVKGHRLYPLLPDNGFVTEKKWPLFSTEIVPDFFTDGMAEILALGCEALWIRSRDYRPDNYLRSWLVMNYKQSVINM